MFSVDLPCGVCDFETVRDHLIACRAKSRIPENARSVLVFLFPYLLEDAYYSGLNISRYAVPADYHTIVGEMLEKFCRTLEREHPKEKFEPFCDNSPIPEVRCAALAGLGCIGENGLLIHPEYGSFVFIGEIVTTMRFPAAPHTVAYCKRCGKCRTLCPAGAIRHTGVDKALCLSDVSQRKGELTQAQRRLLVSLNCAWGCDACQTICPMNAGAKTTPLDIFRQTAVAHLRMPVSMAGRAYAWRGEKVITRNLLLLSGGIE